MDFRSVEEEDGLHIGAEAILRQMADSASSTGWLDAPG